MKKYLVEFIGTFFLVLTIGCTVIPDSAGVIPPLAIGAALMVMIYAGGHVSGAHYNPAVTVAVWMRGRLPASEIVPYWIAQITGALLAALAVRFLVGAALVPGSFQNIPAAFLAEMLFTFALAYVILNVATAKATSGNQYYGLAIAATVTAGVFAVGATSGAAFNPAVALAVTVMNLSSVSNLAVYLPATFAGAALAALAFKFINPEDV